MQEMNRHPPSYNEITKAQFPPTDKRVLSMLDCEPVKRDGFFKRLFKNPDKKKKKKFRN